MTERPDQDGADQADADPLKRFRNWPGFFWATLALNLLFVYGMLGIVGAPGMGIWLKTLVWLPFNAIATAVYYMLWVKLADARGSLFYRALCFFLVAANWSVMLYAGD